MSDDKKPTNNVHLLWHERVNEAKMAVLTEQFILSVKDAGMQLTEIKIAWNNGVFKSEVLGQHMKRRIEDKKTPPNA